MKVINWLFAEFNLIMKHKKLYVAAFMGILSACYDAYLDLPDEAKQKFHLAMSLVVIRLLMKDTPKQNEPAVAKGKTQVVLQSGLNLQHNTIVEKKKKHGTRTPRK